MKTKAQKKLTIFELALWGQCEVMLAGGVVGKIETLDFVNETAVVGFKNFTDGDHPIDHKEFDDNDEFHVNSLKPILRPMSSITDEEVLAVCEIACSTPFISSKKKWNIKRERSDVIYIDTESSHYSFAIYIDKATGYGDVTVYQQYEKTRFPNDGITDDDLMDVETEQTSDIALITKFYIDNKLDCMGLIDSGSAVDKVTLK